MTSLEITLQGSARCCGCHHQETLTTERKNGSQLLYYTPSLCGVDTSFHTPSRNTGAQCFFSLSDSSKGSILQLRESEALGGWANSQGPTAPLKTEAEFESRSRTLCGLARCPPLWVRSCTDDVGNTSGFWQARADSGGSKTQSN